MIKAWAVFFMVLCGVAAPAASAASDDPKTLTVLALGDSLTAGYGLEAGEGFTDQLELWLQEKLGAGSKVKVINAGISGDTSSGGNARVEWSLYGEAANPDVVIVEFGGNDVLRGIDPTYTRKNIDNMVKILTEKNLRVLVAGMQASPSLGPDYTADFNSIFSDVAKKYNATLYPFFLEGVAADEALNQDDGIHPTLEGVQIIVSKIGPVVLEMLLADMAE